MKVILTSQGDSLDAAMDARFGRAAKFLLWDSSTQLSPSLTTSRVWMLRREQASSL